MPPLASNRKIDITKAPLHTTTPLSTVTSSTTAKSTLTTTIPPQSKTMFNVSECYETKGCMFAPEHCDPYSMTNNTCELLVSFRTDPGNPDYVLIELQSSSTDPVGNHTVGGRHGVFNAAIGSWILRQAATMSRREPCRTNSKRLSASGFQRHYLLCPTRYAFICIIYNK